MSSVAVIDYGMGNLHSIAKALQHVEPATQVVVTADPHIILNCERVVFPGVGAIRDCMQALDDSGLSGIIRQVAADKPFLGICLGMQALLTDSEENGRIDCLGIVPGHVVRFADNLVDSRGQALKIPHMGWNQVRQLAHPLWQDIAQDSRFYFVHSYYVVPDDSQYAVGSSEYPHPFTCALAHDNLFAVQFHPEKSHTAGLQLLKNFLHWNGKT